MTQTTATFEAGVEWKLRGGRQMAEDLAISVADQLRFEGYRYTAARRVQRSGTPVVIVRAQGPAGDGPIGKVTFLEAPGDTVWLQVPPFRGGGPETSWGPDEDGRLFGHYLQALRAEYEKLGYTSGSSRLKARSIVDEASRQLAIAEESSYVGVGSTCRAALIALADEVYESHMLPPGTEPPKGDDAPARLTYAIRYRLTGSSDRYRRGVEATAKGTWDIAVALAHRRNASRGEAEICIDQTSVLIDTVARLVATGRPHD